MAGGRPRKEVGRKSRHVTVRLTDEEYAALSEGVAYSSCGDISDYIRSRLWPVVLVNDIPPPNADSGHITVHDESVIYVTYKEGDLYVSNVHRPGSVTQVFGRITADGAGDCLSACEIREWMINDHSGNSVPMTVHGIIGNPGDVEIIILGSVGLQKYQVRHHIDGRPEEATAICDWP